MSHKGGGRGGGGRKVPKKCHVSFEWPQNTHNVSLLELAILVKSRFEKKKKKITALFPMASHFPMQILCFFKWRKI